MTPLLLARSPDLIVIDKPAGAHSHPLHPGETDTMLAKIAELAPEAATPMNPAKPLEGGLVHRLDRGTSGVLACALSAASHAAIRKHWRDPSTEKVYVAWLEGVLATPARLELFLAHDPKSKRRMIARARKPSGQHWPTQTEIQPIATSGDGAATLALIRIHTGVTHQIRATCAWLGHAVLSDPIYRSAKSRGTPSIAKPLDTATAKLFERLREKLGALPPAPRPDLLPEHGFFLHALWLRSDGNILLANGIQAPPPRHFGSP